MNPKEQLAGPTKDYWREKAREALAQQPVGVEGLVERMRQAPSRLWMADLVGQRISVERMRDILTFALAQQPAAVAPVGDSMVQTALRNLPQYIGKSGLVGPDKHSALQCVETLRTALSQQRAVPEAKYPDDGNGDDDAYNRGWNDCRQAMLAAAPQENHRE